MGPGVGDGVDVVVGAGVEVTIGPAMLVETATGDNVDDTFGPLGSLLQPTASVTANTKHRLEIGSQRL